MNRMIAIFSISILGCGDAGKGGGGAPTTQTSPMTQTGDAEIEAVPESLAFLPGDLGASQEDFVTIRNVGSGTLTVTDVTFDHPAFVLLDDWDQSFELAPGELRYVDVVFTVTDLSDVGSMTVHSNDPDQPELLVGLSGQGLFPRLEISPDFYDFGEVEVPCLEAADILLQNVGTADLTISSYDWIFSTEDMALDALTELGVPTVLGAGESVTLTVDYIPQVPDPAALGTLTVQSDDPEGDRGAEVVGSAVYGNTHSETFEDPELPSVDLLFLIDNSCSMEGDNVADINQGIPLLLTELQAVSNWQMIQVTDQGGCSNVPILDGSTVDASQQLIDNAFASVAGNWSEALLSLAATSLSHTGVGGCNHGFLRTGALLYIIVASDEVEQSGFDHTHWLQAYETYVPRPDMVTVSSIVDVNSACGDGSGPGGYLQAANATAGTVLDICTPTWGSELSTIADTLAAAPPIYLLPILAIPASMVVTLDGTVTTDYLYDPNTGVLTLTDPAYIRDVSHLTVDYSVESDCLP